MTPAPRWLPYVVWVLTGFAWAGAFVVVRAAVTQIPPFTFAALRTAIGAAVLVGLALVYARHRRPALPELRFWLLMGVPQLGLPYAALFWSAQYLPSGITATLFATFPAFTALSAHFIVRDEPLTRWKVGGTLLAVVAVGFMVNPWSGGGQLPLFPVLLVMFGVVSASVGAVVVRGHGRRTSTLWLTALQVASGSAVLGVLAILFERDAQIIVSPFTIGAVLYLALVVTVGCYLGLFWLLKQLDATFVAMGTIMESGMAVALGAVLLDETVGGRGLAGLGLVALSVALVSYRHARPAPA